MAEGQAAEAETSGIRAACRCMCVAAGIIISLGAYGVLQERVMSVPYGELELGNQEFFKVSVFLVLCNRLAAILFSLLMVAVKKESYKATVPIWKYVAVSMSNVMATWCQYEALKYVSFPVQMLGKSFKMMPVMLWGIAISGQKYKPQDWLIAAGVTGGVTSFLLTGDISSKNGDKDSSVYGLVLLMGFLACDGFTSTFQEKLFKEHETSKYNQMLYVNSSSAVVSGLTLVSTGGAAEAFSFIKRHPAIIADASMLSSAAVTGQFFIYSLVKEFGALVLAATMNLRQVLSILASYLLYAHPISFPQILSLLLVFGSLFYKSLYSYRKKKAALEKSAGEAAAKPPKASNEETQGLKTSQGYEPVADEDIRNTDNVKVVIGVSMEQQDGKPAESA